MPIHCPITIANLSADEFTGVDHRVMGHAYACHNDLDRLVEQRVPLSRNGAKLGDQRFTTHAPGIAFRLTAFTEDQPAIENHLRRLLALTDLRALQWINLNHARIELKTLMRSGQSGSTE